MDNINAELLHSIMVTSDLKIFGSELGEAIPNLFHLLFSLYRKWSCTPSLEIEMPINDQTNRKVLLASSFLGIQYIIVSHKLKILVKKRLGA